MAESRRRFSIIIPTYRRPHQLTECLRALGELEYPAEQFEVIVVDDGSLEPPKEIVETFSKRMRVRLITMPHGGPGLARNTGAVSAEGRYLVFTDDDCRLAPNYLRVIDARLVSQPDIGVGGRTQNVLAGDVFAEATQQLIDHLYAHFNDALTPPRFFPTTSLVVSRDQFCELGGFDVSFPFAGGEDRDFCERWVAAGFKFLYAPEAVVYHSHALDLRAFLSQHFNYGRGRFFLLRARKLRGEQQRPSLEPAGFYIGLLRRPMRDGFGPHSARLTLLLALTQFSYAMGYARERIRRHPQPALAGTPLPSPNGRARPALTDRPGVVRRADEVEGRESPRYPDSGRRAADSPPPSLMRGPPTGA